MKLFSKRIIAAAIITGISIPATSYATNGFFLIGFGAKSRGMGGVGVAEGVDGLAAANNPATMIDVGTRFDIGGDIFFADMRVTHSDGTLSETVIQEKSDFENTAFSYGGNIFLLPNMGGTYKFSDDITVGFAFIGAGLGTQFNQKLPAGNTSYFFNFNGLGGDDKVGIKLLQVQIPLSIAFRINKQHTVGASFVIAGQGFEAWGLGAFEDLGFGATSGNLSNQGTDISYGAGIRLGWQGKFIDNKLKVGVNYSSRTYMTKFDDYKNLFAEQGDFDIPENYALGIAYNFNPKLNIKFDIQQINFNDVASIGNPGPLANDPSRTEFNPLCPGEDTIECKLGGNLGMGFGWTNQTVYKLGSEFHYNQKLTFRAGLNYGEATIKKDQVLFNLIAPATIEKHLTVGATYHFSEDIELSMSYVHAFENTITGQTLFQPSGAPINSPVDNASLSMKQRSLGFELGIKW
ncbi:putative facilitator of salicylate uptake [hydrothermal vent metagenome]|uniref:Putative facilitator of salicylate uptake n=1 Tax=hydrothermal vent metagenome TaxID=652676 RepID=A0A3B0Z2M0_9ZZZZ